MARKMTEETPTLGELLNAQTGKLTITELLPYFARGLVIVVSPERDLIETAGLVIQDQSEAIEEAMKQKQLHRALDEDAARWQKNQQEFWAVVAAPWVLVQEIS